MDLSMYISNEYYLVVVLLYALGAVIKRYTKIANWTIPIILSVLGGISCSLMSYSTIGSIDPTAVIQGILCGLTAVGTNQIIKQTVQNASISSNSDIDN